MNTEKTKLSAIIIALNEEGSIQKCLESLIWVDEIILVDSGSSDRTKELASKYTHKIFDLEWDGFGRSKEYAKSKATSEWVLSIDADEIVSEGLRDEILVNLNSGQAVDGYFIPRKSSFLGRWILHSGWYPDHILRLFRKDKGRFTSQRVHEKVEVEGRTGYLRNNLLHHTDPNLDHYLRKLNLYTTIAAEQMHGQGKRSNLPSIIFRPLAGFFRIFFLKTGFLDGMEGFVLACCSAFHVFFKYAKLWHLNRNSYEKNNPQGG